MKTIEQLAQEAPDVQNACNLVAVLNGAIRAIKEIRELTNWDAADNHPITRLWVDKIASLTSYPQDPGTAYQEVFAILDAAKESALDV